MINYTELYAFTESLENNQAPSNGLPTSTWPFYVDKQGHFNFGYGLDFIAFGTANAEDVLVNVGMTDADLDLVDSYLEGTISLTQLNQSITQQNWQSIATQAVTYYYTNTAIPYLTTKLTNLGLNIETLPQGIATGLADLIYNAPHAISTIPNLALSLAAGNWGDAAYAVWTSPSTDVRWRRAAEAMVMLGYTPTLDGNHLITSITANTDFNGTAVAQFLYDINVLYGHSAASIYFPNFYPTMVTDVINQGIFQVEAGGLVVSEPGTNGTVTFDAGTYDTSGYEYNSPSGKAIVSVLNGDGTVVGSFSIDPRTGASVYTPGDYNPGNGNNPPIDLPIGSITVDPISGGGFSITDTTATGNVWTADINSSGNLAGAITTFGNDPFPHGGTLRIGGYTSPIITLFNSSQTDPIVLDLSGDNSGVQLTSLAASDAYFDLHGTGFAVHTGWVGPTTGILVDNADPTSISDLFGNSSVDGFTALESLDSNGDGIINSSDPGFSSLYVWEDSNGNGVVDSGEVQSLSSLGITSIDLNTTVENETVNGNLIGEIATFNYSDGSSGEVAEAFFDNSQVASEFTGSYTINPLVLDLPNLRGYGTVPDLYIAMSLNSTLFDMVQNLSVDSISDASTFNEQVQNIIYEWAGVTDVDPTSRGGFINAQQLEVMEAFMGETWENGYGTDNPSNYHQGLTLETAYSTLFLAIEERLLAQGPLAPFLSGVSFDYNNDAMTGTTDFTALTSAITAYIPPDQTTALQYLGNLGQFVSQLAIDLGVSASSYDTAFQSAFAQIGVNLSIDTIDNLFTLSGGYSDGSYVFSFNIEESSITSAGAIVDGTGQTNTVLNANGAIDQDIIIDVQRLNVIDTTTLTSSEFSNFDSIEGSGSIYAATGGTYDLSSKSSSSFNMYAESNDGTILIGDNSYGQILQASTSGNDLLEAGGGSTTLYAGYGADTLMGTTGDDTFVLADVPSGTSVGNMVIEGGTGSSTIQSVGDQDFTAFTISNVQNLDLYGSSASVTLTADEFSGFDSIYGSGTINAATGGTYDLSSRSSSSFNMYAESNDGTTLIGDDSDNQTLQASSSGNDTLIGGSGAGDILNAGTSFGNDLLESGSGSTTLYAGYGADTLEGGSGDNTFVVEDIFGLNISLADLVIDGGAGNNTLELNNTQDLTTFTISNIQNLDINGTATLTAEQFNGFDSLSGYGTIKAATGGVYDLASVSDGFFFNIYALSNDGTTIIGDTADGENIYASSSGNDSLVAGDGDNNNLWAGGGNDTLVGGAGSGDYLSAQQEFGNNILTAGSGNTTLVAGYGNDTLTGGEGDDTFVVSDPYNLNIISSTTIDGEDGNNTLQINGQRDLTDFTISNVQNLDISGTVTLTADQFNGFDNVYGNGTINTATGGTYDIASVSDGSYFTVYALSNDGTTIIGDTAYGENIHASASGNDSLVAGDGDNNDLWAGGGNDTLVGGAGSGDQLSAEQKFGNNVLVAGSGDTTLIAGYGDDTLTGGSGDDTFIVSDPYNLNELSNTVIDGGDGNNTLQISGQRNLTDFTISNVQNLDISGTVTLTADQFNAFDNVYGYGTINAATGGTYDVASVSDGSFFNIYALSNDGTTIIGDTAYGENIYASASGNDSIVAGDGDNNNLWAGGGNDTLVGGAGSGDQLYAQNSSGNDLLEAGSGDTTLYASSGNDTLDGSTGDDTFALSNATTGTINGGGGYNIYQASSSISDYTINNNGGSSANGEIDFTNLSSSQLWFQQTGNNLEIDVLGTTDKITVAGWFGSSAGAQVESINDDTGLTLDSQVSQLVTAMATYAANNAGFSVAAASAMPTDTALQTALASAWHA